MKTVFTILATTLISTASFAKTYMLASGKWTDAQIWNNQYPGTTIKANDVVVITGQVTMNTGIVVEGTLKVEKGAFMVGMKDLVITKSGNFVNDGNTVMKRIINEGSIHNNLLMEAMMDVDNKGNIDNNNNMVAGNNFDNMGGHAAGKAGAYFVNNNVLTSPKSDFGKDVQVLYAKQIETAGKETSNTTSLQLTASFKNEKGVELNVANPANIEVTMFSIEKSTDGQTYSLLETISGKKTAGAMNYTDENINSNLTYYRIKALNVNGDEITLPIAAVKAPGALTASN